MKTMTIDGLTDQQATEIEALVHDYLDKPRDHWVPPERRLHIRSCASVITTTMACDCPAKLLKVGSVVVRVSK